VGAHEPVNERSVPGPVRVALDLLGGDDAPGVVVAGALLVADERPDVEVVLVGPPDVAAGALAERGAAGRLEVVAASQVIGMAEDPARAVRAKRDATVRVAARLVRDGEADATVSIGSTGAAMAAGLFTLGRVHGVTRPALALVLPAVAGSVVLLDVGATVECTPDLLAQFALAGAAYATVRLGLAAPRVGLLSVGAEPGKGDPLRKAAYDVLSSLPIRFVGNVEGGDVPLGGRADVVVADGFSGNVLLKGVEGAYAMCRAALHDALGPAAVPALAALDPLHPERLGGAMLLGVNGVSVVGHGGASARAVASSVELAAQAVADGLLPRLTDALGRLVAQRRAAAGLGVTP
jgi:glycerol-3-phosphate acyltransferase PlsX